MIMIDHLRYLREALRVTRCHTELTVHQQTLGEHSAGVALLCFYLQGVPPSAALLMAALAHDLPEKTSGDIPGPSKRVLNNEALESMEAWGYTQLGILWPPLMPHEQRTLGLADTLDLLLFCSTERAMGNTMVRAMARNASLYLREFYPLSEQEQRVADAILQLWREADQ